MKRKFLPVLLTGAFILAAATACSGGGGNVTAGLGVVSNFASSRSATDEAAGYTQVDSTIAAVTLDGGVITHCSIDAAQTRVNINAAGEITSDPSAPVQSKKERGNGYNMRNASPIGKEWFEQAEAFEKWVVGKTPAQVAGMKTKRVDDNHPRVPDVADLTASCTINVGEMLDAVALAVQNAK